MRIRSNPFASGVAIATALVVAATIVASAVIASVAARPTPAYAANASSPNDAWLDRLNGKHRQLFDAPAPNGGIPLVHLMNFYDSYNSAYGVKDKDVNGILDLLWHDDVLRRERRDVGQVSHRRVPRGE